MTVRTFPDRGPELEFCCAGARRAWDAEVINIVPKPAPEGQPRVFTAALHYEGGSSLAFAYCPFCAAPVTPGRELPASAGVS